MSNLDKKKKIDPFIVINESRKKNKTFDRNGIIETLETSYKVTVDKNQKNLVMIYDTDAKFGSMIIDLYTGKLICGDLPKVIETDKFDEIVDGTTLFNGITIKLYYYYGKWRISTTKYIDACNAKYKNVPIANTFFNFIKNNDCFAEFNKIGDKTPQKVNLDTLDTKMTYIYSFYDPSLSNVINHGPNKLCRILGIYDNVKRVFIPQNSKFQFDRASVDLMEVGMISDKYIVYSENYKKRQAILSNIQNESFCILKNINNRKTFIEILGKSYEDKFDDLTKFIETKFKNILQNYNNAFKLKSEDVFIRFEIICTKLHMCYLQKEKINIDLVRKIFYEYPTEIQAFIMNIKIQ